MAVAEAAGRRLRLHIAQDPARRHDLPHAKIIVEAVAAAAATERAADGAGDEVGEDGKHGGVDRSASSFWRIQSSVRPVCIAISLPRGAGNGAHVERLTQAGASGPAWGVAAPAGTASGGGMSGMSRQCWSGHS